MIKSLQDQIRTPILIHRNELINPLRFGCSINGNNRCKYQGSSPALIVVPSPMSHRQPCFNCVLLSRIASQVLEYFCGFLAFHGGISLRYFYLNRLLHSEVESCRNLQANSAIKALLSCSKDLKPKPPFSLLIVNYSHFRLCIFLRSLKCPHQKFLII